MKLPRGLSGAELVAALKRLGYQQTRQTGSHVRLTLSFPRQAHLTVPLARAIPPGTLAALVKDAALHLDTTVDDILSKIR
ncbi:MAG: type II toxin-antitoxin system HicA family toxin [Acidobacteria bacterium]|nr:type II toxin-antitoxin system HicA family toxin [Acidobacteriota bacterium]